MKNLRIASCVYLFNLFILASYDIFSFLYFVSFSFQESSLSLASVSLASVNSLSYQHNCYKWFRNNL